MQKRVKFHAYLIQNQLYSVLFFDIGDVSDKEVDECVSTFENSTKQLCKYVLLEISLFGKRIKKLGILSSQ